MKTIEQTRRELFETAYLKKYFYPAERWSLVPEKYRTQHAEIAWWAFNAALDAVVIEFPQMTGEDNGGCFHDAEVYDQTVNDCRAAIESTNLGLKII